MTPWIGFFEKSLRAARIAGDIEDGIQPGKAGIWFIHHLSNTLHLISLPSSDVVDYGVTQEELTEIAIRFLLRGLGLKNSAIQRHYKPIELKSILKNITREDS